MYTRPYEGLVVSLPAAVVLAVWLVRLGPRAAAIQSVRVGGPALLILGLAAAWLGCYQAAVTGSPFRMPYRGPQRRLCGLPQFPLAVARPAALLSQPGDGRLLRRLGATAFRAQEPVLGAELFAGDQASGLPEILPWRGLPAAAGGPL